MPRTSPLITRYIGYLVIERGLARNTTAAYTSDLLQLQIWASKNQLNLRGLTNKNIRRHVGELSRADLNASSIDRAISSIRGFYQFLFSEGEIPINPADDVSSLKKTRARPHVLTADETRRLLSSPDQSTLNGLRDRALLEILFAAGLRLSEAIHLRHRDVSVDRRILRCVGKGNKERQVPFSQSAADSLKRYISSKQPPRETSSNVIFLNRGESLTRQFAWTIIKDHAHRAGLQNVRF